MPKFVIERELPGAGNLSKIATVIDPATADPVDRRDGGGE